MASRLPSLIPVSPALNSHKAKWAGDSRPDGCKDPGFINRRYRHAATPLGSVKVSHISAGRHIEHATNVLLAFSQLLNAAETVLSPKYSQSGPDDNGWDVAKGLREKVDAALTQISADASARTS